MPISCPGEDVLRTERLILRRPQVDDLNAWQTFFVSNRAVFIGGGPSKDEELGWRAFATLLGHWRLNKCGPLVVVLADKPIGAVGPWYPAGWPEKELSWSIWSAEHEGFGFAEEAARRVREHVFADLRWPTAVSYIARENGRSIALAERLGCVHDKRARAPDGDPSLVYRHPPFDRS